MVPAALAAAALLDRCCTPCHAAEDLRRPVRRNRTAWQALLGDHGRSCGEEDRLILDFLAGGG